MPKALRWYLECLSKVHELNTGAVSEGGAVRRISAVADLEFVSECDGSCWQVGTEADMV